MNIAEAIHFEQPRLISAEDQVRADFYALLANLFYRAPNHQLLQAIMIAPEPSIENDRALAEAWRALAAASGVVTARHASASARSFSIEGSGAIMIACNN